MAEAPASSTVFSSILLPSPATTSLTAQPFASTTPEENHQKLPRSTDADSFIETTKNDKSKKISKNVTKVKHERIQACSGRIGFVKPKNKK